MSTESDRLDAVHEILSNGKRPIRSIQAVAAEHGFTDLATFNRAFKEKFGKSPVALRDFAKKKAKPGRR